MLPLMPLLAPPPEPQAAAAVAAPAAATANALIETGMRVGREAAAPPAVTRARVCLGGAPAQAFAWRLSLDGLASQPTQPAAPLVDDAWVEAPVGPAAVRMGYFTLPLSGEALIPARDLPTVRRAAYNAPEAAFGLAKAAGVMVSRPAAGTLLSAGAFVRGAGAGDPLGLDGIARLAVRPLPHTTLSVVTLVGAQARGRTGVELELDAEPATFHAEALEGMDGAVHRFGWSTLATWRFAPAWRAVAGLAAWDDGLHEAGSLPEHETTLGVSWQVMERAEILADMIHLATADGGADDEALLVWRLTL